MARPIRHGCRPAAALDTGHTLPGHWTSNPRLRVRSPNPSLGQGFHQCGRSFRNHADDPASHRVCGLPPLCEFGQVQSACVPGKPRRQVRQCDLGFGAWQSDRTRQDEKILATQPVVLAVELQGHAISCKTGNTRVVTASRSGANRTDAKALAPVSAVFRTARFFFSKASRNIPLLRCAIMASPQPPFTAYVRSLCKSDQEAPARKRTDAVTARDAVLEADNDHHSAQ